MQRFAALLDRLSATPARNGKLRLLRDYLSEAPDPDRGWALAALTGGLDLPTVKPAMLRGLVEARVDPVLFRLSYDYVGDLAETVSLIWGEAAAGESDLSLSAVVESLMQVSRAGAPRLVEGYLDAMEPASRFALMKLATGGLRVGVSARLAKQALADWGSVEVAEIEELWHGLAPPYGDLFAWLEGRGPKPEQAAKAPFRPMMLANPVEDGDLAGRAPADYLAEWKWDGIRVQAACEDGVRRLYSRTGDDISAAFPDLIEALDTDATLDGELLVARGGDVGTFSDLQQRLNRKTVSGKLLASHPVFLRAYDLLAEGAENLRPLPFEDRRARLERLAPGLDPARFDLSPLVPFPDWETLAQLRAEPPHPAIEGVMLKRRDAAYVPGRPKGPWFKWKKDPHTVDAGGLPVSVDSKTRSYC